MLKLIFALVVACVVAASAQVALANPDEPLTGSAGDRDHVVSAVGQ